jgi:hypothetical protein
MDAMLAATGFTGALTLLWLVRLFRGQGRGTAEVTFAAAEERAEPLLRAIAAARREVLLWADRLASRPLAQALIDAKLRGVGVEVLLDAANEHDAESDLHFLVEQGLPPFLEEAGALAGRLVCVVDGGTVAVGSLSDAAGLVVLHEHGGAAGAYRAEFGARKAQARALPSKAAAPPEEVQAPLEESPAPPAEDVLTAVAKGLTATEDEAPAATGPAPLVTPAAAEMLARLRKEMAQVGDADEAPPAQKLAG